VHNAARKVRVGELSPRAGQWTSLSDDAEGTDGPLRYLIHRAPDGLTWRLDAGPDGATCTRTNAQPDATLDIQALSSLYLGGASAALLASAGRIHPHRPESVATLSRLFRVDPEPFNSFAF
jgi:hypothetical protein